MTRTVTPFLMFDGAAEEAINFYVSLFSDGKIETIDYYGPDEGGAEGSVKRASFALSGQRFVCIDSPVKQDFTFTPSISIFVECEDAEELDGAFTALSADGSVLMPPADYGFSDKFTWVNDRFGVSWQLNFD